jgi:hypothetical protein
MLIKLEPALYQRFVGVRGTLAELGGTRHSSFNVDVGVAGTVTRKESVSGDESVCHPNAGFNEACVTSIAGIVSGARCVEHTACPRAVECRVCDSRFAPIQSNAQCFSHSVAASANCCSDGHECYRSANSARPDGRCLLQPTSDFSIAYSDRSTGFTKTKGCTPAAADAITITTGTPTLESHSLRYLELEMKREPYTHCPGPGGCGTRYVNSQVLTAQDSVQLVRWVPVTGVVVLGNVPKTLTVATRNNLVFNVLHDPPGGGSFATWSEGSEKNFRLTVSGEMGSSTTGPDITHRYCINSLPWVCTVY